MKDKLISDREEYIAAKEKIYIDYKYTLNHELPPVYYMYQGTINYIDYLLEKIDKEDEVKDIPFIPDDELYVFKGDSRELNYNFRVLKEKINQVIEAINNENI